MRKRLKKILRKIKKNFSLTKREKFGLIIGVLTLFLVVIQLSSADWRYPLTALLILLTYLLSVWGLKEDLEGVEWVTLLILPVMYSAALTLFYFLLPVRWLTRLPTAIIFAIGMYAILLVENIYNVAAVHTIQLLRAAHSVGFLMTLLTYFLLLSLVFSFHLSFYKNLIIVYFLSFFLVLQSLWSMKLETKISSEMALYTLTISLVLSEISLAVSFWPISGILGALFLTTVFYSLVGMVQQYLVERLFKRTTTEFLVVLSIVFILILLTTRWGG